jgi:hypothetical protein
MRSPFVIFAYLLFEPFEISANASFATSAVAFAVAVYAPITPRSDCAQQFFIVRHRSDFVSVRHLLPPLRAISAGTPLYQPARREWQALASGAETPQAFQCPPSELPLDLSLMRLLIQPFRDAVTASFPESVLFTSLVCFGIAHKSVHDTRRVVARHSDFAIHLAQHITQAGFQQPFTVLHGRHLPSYTFLHTRSAFLCTRNTSSASHRTFYHI